tara:strand:- start:705 stop:929 length:225 start_codon:yes stop_codon:yes gene_type:complete
MSDYTTTTPATGYSVSSDAQPYTYKVLTPSSVDLGDRQADGGSSDEAYIATDAMTGGAASTTYAGSDSVNGGSA